MIYSGLFNRIQFGLNFLSVEDAIVPAYGRKLIATGISITTPIGTYGRVAPRSGLALKSGISTGAGVIDADYTGPVGVILFNHSEIDFEGKKNILYCIYLFLCLFNPVKKGDRIAQLILERIAASAEISVVDELNTTERGSGGFGSTGTN